MWKRTGKYTYSYQVREDLYIDGNAGGFFYAEAIVQLDPRLGELCSGGPQCPGTGTDVRVTQFDFAPDGTITGETDLLPAGAQALTACKRLSVVFPALP